MSMTILEIATEELKRLNPDSVNYFDWRKRREIYKLLNVNSSTTSNPRHKFLAIQTAEFVLPSFRQTYLEDSLVFELFECAKAILDNRVDDFEKLSRTEDAGYHASEWFGYNFENNQRDFQSTHAGFTAYKALVEVRHMIDPWKNVGRLSKGDGISKYGSTTPTGWTNGEEFTDEDWSHLAALGDTAAAASFAYSTSSTSNQCQPKLLYDFWKWWAEVALPKALAYEST